VVFGEDESGDEDVIDVVDDEDEDEDGVDTGAGDVIQSTKVHFCLARKQV